MSTNLHSDEQPRLAVPVGEVASLLGISTRHVWALVRRGQLPLPIRLGRAVRWNLEELREWIRHGAPAIEVDKTAAEDTAEHKPESRD